MDRDLPPRPEPQADAPERAPGGPDASLTESDVGAAGGADAVTPDPPVNAQSDEDLPVEVEAPEDTGADEAGPDDDTPSEPSA